MLPVITVARFTFIRAYTFMRNQVLVMPSPLPTMKYSSRLPAWVPPCLKQRLAHKFTTQYITTCQTGIGPAIRLGD